MYLACSTLARMSGTDMTLLRGTTRSDSLQACEVDQTCQYHQHGLHMSVDMPIFLRTCQHKFLPAVNSGRMAPQVIAWWDPSVRVLVVRHARDLWGPHVRAWWDPHVRVLVGPACQRSMGSAC